MQLSDREIQKSLDLLRKKSESGQEDSADARRAENAEGIHDVVKQIEEIPDVRRDRVEKLKKALETSSYDVSGDDVAKKLIGRMFSDKIR